MEFASLVSFLLEWDFPDDGEAAKSRELCLGLLRGTPAPFSRDQFTPGHITGTACVLHPSREAVLLIHHAKLDRWLLPGGHVEPDLDPDASATAWREATEETGVALDPGVAPILCGIDVHFIPARKSDPFHLHHDLIFRFRAKSAELTGSDEVHGFVWCPVDEFDRYQLPSPIRRAARRAFNR